VNEKHLQPAGYVVNTNHLQPAVKFWTLQFVPTDIDYKKVRFYNEDKADFAIALKNGTIISTKGIANDWYTFYSTVDAWTDNEVKKMNNLVVNGKHLTETKIYEYTILDINGPTYCVSTKKRLLLNGVDSKNFLSEVVKDFDGQWPGPEDSKMCGDDFCDLIRTAGGELSHYYKWWQCTSN
jgi:hypothetical protein